MTKKQDSTKNIEAEKQKTSAKKRSKKEIGSKSVQQNKRNVEEAEPKTNHEAGGGPEVVDISKDDIIEVDPQPHDQKQTLYSPTNASNPANLVVIITGGILAVAIGFGAAIGLYKYGVLIAPPSPNEVQVDIETKISKQKFA